MSLKNKYLLESAYFETRTTPKQSTHFHVIGVYITIGLWEGGIQRIQDGFLFTSTNSNVAEKNDLKACGLKP